MQIVSELRCEVGENPLWHLFEQCLYWVDIPAGRLYRYDPAAKIVEMPYEGTVIGGFTIQADGSLLLFMAGGAIAEWRSREIRFLRKEIPAERDSRFNDVIADSRGRVFCGTMSSADHPGRLYRLDLDGSLTTVLEGVQCSNGMAFSADNRFFYYTDSYAREIYRFDYSESSGEIGNRTVLIRTAESDGFPDGLIRDQEGSLWSARWAGGCIVRYSATGEEIQRLAVPARNVTSMTFGGTDFSDLFITTAKDTEAGGQDKVGGALFHLKSSVVGVPEFYSRVSVP